MFVWVQWIQVGLGRRRLFAWLTKISDSFNGPSITVKTDKLSLMSQMGNLTCFNNITVDTGNIRTDLKYGNKLIFVCKIFARNKYVDASDLLNNS